MKKALPLIIALPLLMHLPSAFSAQSTQIKILNLNIWQEGTMITGGYQAIIDSIIAVNPDIVTLEEVRNYKDDFQQRLAADLKKRGYQYNAASTFQKYGKNLTAGIGKKGTDDTGILSKYPIISYDSGEKSTRATLNINGKNATVYALHLSYRNLSQYNPRGHSGDCCGYKALPEIITDEQQVLAEADKSQRVPQIKAVLKDAEAFRQKKDIVIIAGDFNEPSHLDWTEKMRNEFQHNGAVIRWRVSSLVNQAGYLDTFRTLHPDELKHPGMTWLANNPEKLDPDIKDPGIDERDRIDFIYVDNSGQVEIVDSKTYGPAGEVVGGQRDPDEIESEKIVVPQSKVWPTDHLGVVTTLVLKDK